MNHLKTQVKHLSEELNRRREAETQAAQVQDVNANPGSGEYSVMARDLEAAREMVRSLNSQNSELRLEASCLRNSTLTCFVCLQI